MRLRIEGRVQRYGRQGGDYLHDSLVGTHPGVDALSPRIEGDKTVGVEQINSVFRDLQDGCLNQDGN